MAQSVECLMLDFGSGHDPSIVGSSPASGSALSVEPAWDSLSLPSAPFPRIMLSLKNKNKTKKYSRDIGNYHICFDAYKNIGRLNPVTPLRIAHKVLEILL